MSTITIELTGSERKFVEEQVARGKSPSPAAYVNELIRRQRFRDEEMPDDDITDEELAAETRERASKAKVDELIREGIESGPAIEMTDAEWDKLWHEVDESYAKGNGR